MTAQILERKLVEVLVEQQKKLLHTLNDEGVMISRGLDSAGPHVTKRTTATMMSTGTLPDVTSPMTTRHRTSKIDTTSPHANRQRTSKIMSPSATQGRTSLVGFNNSVKTKVTAATRSSMSDSAHAHTAQNNARRNSVLFKKGGKLSDE
jgi:hypothetical protein